MNKDNLTNDDILELRFIQRFAPAYPTLDLNTDAQMAKLVGLDLVWKRQGRWELTSAGRIALAPKPKVEERV